MTSHNISLQLLTLSFFFFMSNVHAGYIERKAEGWHFYEPLEVGTGCVLFHPINS
jgi:hypothetical protein